MTPPAQSVDVLLLKRQTIDALRRISTRALVIRDTYADMPEAVTLLRWLNEDLGHIAVNLESYALPEPEDDEP